MVHRLFILTTICCIALSASTQSYVDSLAQYISTAADSRQKVDALNELAYELRMANPDSTLLLTEQSEALARELEYPLGIADAKMRQAIAYTARGDYYLALQLFLECQLTFEAENSPHRIAANLNNIGRIYNFINDYEQALAYYQQSVKQYAALGELTREGNILNNIGYIHKLNGDYQQALATLHESLDRAVEMKDRQSELYPTYNIGSVYVRMSNLDSAAKYLGRSEILALENRDQYILSLTNIDKGLMYQQSGDIERAKSHFSQAYQVAKDVGMRSEQRDAAKYLSQLYEESGEDNNALQYYKVYNALDDSLVNRNITRRIAFQEAQYEFDQAKAREEIERKQLEIEKEKELADAIWMRNTLFVGLIAMVLITIQFYRNFIRKRKANEQLKRLNKQIEAQSVELRRANKEITVMNNNLELIVNRRTAELKRRNKQLKEYLSSNSHIVRAPLARILGLVDLYDSADTENLDFINKSLFDSATELDNALRDINKRLSDEN